MTFIPLCKVDAAQRLVYGQIDETPDRSGEVFDYASSKPYFSDWSRAAAKATDGKSLGNIRAMHGKVAAGKLEGIHFDDATKSISLVARIVDDGEWDKVEQGVYTGFSPGGRYLKRWQENGLTRYTAQPSEISIVDLPCIPSANFTMVKADGATETREFFPSAARAAGDHAAPCEHGLEKRGARNSDADLQRIQAMHDTAVELGATCCKCGDHSATDADADADAAGFTKLAGELGSARAELEKMTNKLGGSEAALEKMAGERDSLRKRVTELEALPAAGGPVLKVLSKSDDYAPADAEDLFAKINAMPEGLEKSRELIKLSHRNPLSGRSR